LEAKAVLQWLYYSHGSHGAADGLAIIAAATCLGLRLHRLLTTVRLAKGFLKCLLPQELLYVNRGRLTSEQIERIDDILWALTQEPQAP